MVHAYHCIMTYYGFWLPNDPRGSWSDTVRSFELLCAGGPATRTTERRSLARKPYDPQWKRDVNYVLQYEPVRLTKMQCRVVGHGFKIAAAESDYPVYACSILPRHAHLVLGRSKHLSERAMAHLKTRATQELRRMGMHPFDDERFMRTKPPPVWTKNSWKVYLNTLEDIERAIKYVENNPMKDGHKSQRWSFVEPFRGLGFV